VPRRGWIGPWGHLYPHQGVPGPAAGFLQEALLWWDQWLKDVDTGVMDEPMLRVWMQEWVDPLTAHVERPGRWAGEPEWPPLDRAAAALTLGDGGTLGDAVPPTGPVEITGAQIAGADGGTWCSWGKAGDLPADQRAEDGRSLTFTSERLPERVQILGFPEVTLALSADRPNALVAVRLCDVAPGGESLLVTRGLLNLTHRHGHADPRPVVPGERMEVTVRLNGIAHEFEPGHRVRVAVSPTYWPLAWPSPEPVALTVEGGRLDLPVRPAGAPDGNLREPPPAEGAEPLPGEVRPPVGAGLSVTFEPGTGRLTRVWTEGTVETHLRGGPTLEYATLGEAEYVVTEGDPLSAAVTCRWTVRLTRGDWRIRIETRSTMTADAECFRLTNAVDAYEGDARAAARTWSAAIPRDHV
jgi:uncharacterized protein